MEQLEIPVPQPPPQIQFGLKTILAITTGFAVLFASGYWFGVAGYVGFFLVVALLAILAIPVLRQPEIFVLYLLTLLAALWAPAVPNAREAARRSKCTGHFKQIGLGLQNYADFYGCFPPVCVTNKNGKPMHSWRVLILPFIEHRLLYDQYDFDEPWDGPNNSRLASQMPSVFRCPSDTTSPAATTNYLAVVGPETIWQPNRGTTFKEIRDGSSHTIAVVEASGVGINWMEPRDLPFSAVAKGINPKQGVGMSSHHPGAVIAVFADGHTQTISETISPETLKALFTKAGGETIDEDY